MADFISSLARLNHPGEILARDALGCLPDSGALQAYAATSASLSTMPRRINGRRKTSSVRGESGIAPRRSIGPAKTTMPTARSAPARSTASARRERDAPRSIVTAAASACRAAWNSAAAFLHTLCTCALAPTRAGRIYRQSRIYYWTFGQYR
jgi:hypothetical protein